MSLLPKIRERTGQLSCLAEGIISYCSTANNGDLELSFATGDIYLYLHSH